MTEHTNRDVFASEEQSVECKECDLSVNADVIIDKESGLLYFVCPACNEANGW